MYRLEHVMLHMYSTSVHERSFLTVDCGSLSDPLNGVVMTTGTTLSSDATYTCDNGYTRSGDQTRVCLASGDWSGSEPSCNREYIV